MEEGDNVQSLVLHAGRHTLVKLYYGEAGLIEWGIAEVCFALTNRNILKGLTIQCRVIEYSAEELTLNLRRSLKLCICSMTLLVIVIPVTFPTSVSSSQLLTGRCVFSPVVLL